MKIVGIDNYNTELVSDTLVAENIKTKTFAETMAIALNEKFCYEGATYYYKAVEDDYRLYKFNPNGEEDQGESVMGYTKENDNGNS